MKLQGKIVNWHDKKGFGFVETTAGGKRAFVHIKAFRGRIQRPVNGDLISYELMRESPNGYKAENIEFVFHSKRKGSAHRPKKNSLNFSFFVTFTFCIGVALSVLMGRLPVLIVGLYSLMSVFTFIVYAIDKSAAQNGRWRTKERTLHLLALFGGWPGAFWAQYRLRHKSSKGDFKALYWLTVILNMGLLFYLYTQQGVEFMDRIIYHLSFINL